MRLWKTNIFKKLRNFLMPAVPAWSVKKQKNNRGIFRQCIFNIFASLRNPRQCKNIKPLIGLQLVVMWATHEGNKSHNPSLQASNPYIQTASNATLESLKTNGKQGGKHVRIVNIVNQRLRIFSFFQWTEWKYTLPITLLKLKMQVCIENAYDQEQENLKDFNTHGYQPRSQGSLLPALWSHMNPGNEVDGSLVKGHPLVSRRTTRSR